MVQSFILIGLLGHEALKLYSFQVPKDAEPAYAFSKADQHLHISV